MAWKSIEYARAYHAEYMRELRAWLKEHHYCCDCQKQDAYTLNGRRRCADCTEKKNKKEVERCAKIRQSLNDKAKTVLHNRKASGCCTKCGMALPEKYPYKMCEKCRWKEYARHEKRKTELPRSVIYREKGLCVTCGAERMDGETMSGNPIQLCGRCYRNLVEAGKKGREKYTELYGKSWGARRYEWEHTHHAPSSEFRKT